jgi:hypothetical protein
MPTAIIHLMNEDPILGELDSLPATNDTVIVVKNPRRKDGKDVHYIDPSVTSVIWPINRIAFIEVLPLGEDEEIITHVRE